MLLASVASESREFASALRELALGVAAVVGAVVAWRGLDAWRHQLRGKTEYEVGLSLLRASFRVREGIALVRHPLLEASEMAAALETPELHADQLPLGRTAAYEARWKVIAEAAAELDAARTEAEVLWGSVPADRVNVLKRLVGTLRWAVSTALSDQGKFEAQLSPEQRKDIRETMYSMPGTDSFGDSVESAVRGIEEFVRRRLKIELDAAT